MTALLISVSCCALLGLGLILCARSRPAGALLAITGGLGVAALAGSDPVCGEPSAFGHTGRCSAAGPLASGPAIAILIGAALLCAWLREPVMAPLLLAAAAALASGYVRDHRAAAGELDPAALLEAIAGGLWFVFAVAACLVLWPLREMHLRPRRAGSVRSARRPEVPLAAEMIR